jgi:NAD(P)H dehydrogenase (quinone)
MLKESIPVNQIVGLARSVDKAGNLDVEIRKGDYNIKDHFLEAFRDIDTLLIISGMDKPEKRIIQHRNIINAAKERGVRKIVYTSIIGSEEGNNFAPIVSTNRQTEKDIKDSGLDWVIGRNGLYIEPDIEYIDNYIKRGKISNCAGEGKCSYTTRNELAYAYVKMITENKHNSKVYNLSGNAITQYELAELMNKYLNTNLVFESVTVEEYREERISELGEFLGTIIAGIYEGIKQGNMHLKSDYSDAAGRDHINWDDYFSGLQ